MNLWHVFRAGILGLIINLLFVGASANGQNSSSGSEVYLSFNYRGIVNVYVTTYYKKGDFYLPVSELFNLLKITHEVHQGKLSISGNYLGNKAFILDFNHRTGRAGDLKIQLKAGEFVIRKIDYFVKPVVFKKLFGLNFTIDFNSLSLELETKDKLPVVAQYQRKQKRQRLDRRKPAYERNYYPLKYERHYSALDGAFLDYNLSAVYAANSRLLTFSNAVGVEFLGGDVQGNIYGALSGETSSFTTSGLRWRFVQRKNDFFSSLIAGQTSSEGIAGRSFTGIKISNKPVEPRLLFDRYVIDGNVPAQSEVELYLNNRLVDYQRADQSGNYRFLVPLTYGSTNYSVRIYTPSGRAIEQDSRIQIPFDYLPPGEIDYTLSGGRLENPILGSTDRGYIGAASLSTGITNWLTARASAEYLTDYHISLPSITGTLNARLFSNYLISANINSEDFYRLTTSVVYGNGASWGLSYDYNRGDSKLYSIGGYDHRARFNLFTPFNIGEQPLNVRWAGVYQKNEGRNLFRYRIDLNTRLGRLNVRLGYRDQQIGALALTATQSSRITNSYTYSLGRYNSIPGLFRGMFIRGQLSYLPRLQRFEEMNFQLSRDFLETGRIQLSFGRNFLGDFNSLSLSFTINFDHFRSNTTSRIVSSGASFTQNFRGSVAYDSYGNQFMLNNRQQVGQAGAAVRLFVDKNNDGDYQKNIDNVINDPAVRLSRAAGRTGIKNGINYISKLRPYYRYNIEINKSALSNPLLVPAVENFSIVTDPNQYKPIEIPFYLSGVISGKVELKQHGQFQGLSGVRLYLEADSSSTRESFSKELRTFSDGSFYAYEIPPGDYNLYIDPNQLSFLQAVSKPDTMQITIEALAMGDFLEGLNFTVLPKADTTSIEKTKDSAKTFYQVQIASFSTLKRAKNFRKKIAERHRDSLLIIFNVANKLYAVRTFPTTKYSQAKELISSIYKKGHYSDAALVVLKNNPENYSVSKNKFVQIGAFSTKERALAFVSSAAPKLEKEILVTFNEEIDLYKVLVNNAEGLSTKELRKLLVKIRNIKSFDDAFIYEDNIKSFSGTNYRQREMKFDFRITVKAMPPESEQAVLALLNEYPNSAFTYLKGDILEITSKIWPDILALRKKLAEIPGVNPVIVLVEKRMN